LIIFIIFFSEAQYQEYQENFAHHQQQQQAYEAQHAAYDYPAFDHGIDVGLPQVHSMGNGLVGGWDEEAYHQVKTTR